jgi:ferredoxin
MEMCEFCTEHGEGKKWYLKMKNYSDELLHEELSAPQKRAAGVRTRTGWLNRFLEELVIPAAGVSTAGDEAQRAPSSDQAPQIQPSAEEILRNRKIAHFGQVLPIEDVAEVLDVVDSITRLPCGCRYVLTGKTDQRYCFGLGIDTRDILGKYPDAASSLEVLDKEEAKRLFGRYDEEGLVHSIWTGVTPYIIGLCNCDRDCAAYRRYIEKGGPPSFFRAEYICRVNPDLCTGCKACMSQCQFGAQFYSSALSKVDIAPERCFGCGVCRAACPTDAIELVPRRQSPEAADLWLQRSPR